MTEDKKNDMLLPADLFLRGGGDRVKNLQDAKRIVEEYRRKKRDEAIGDGDPEGGGRPEAPGGEG